MSIIWRNGLRLTLALLLVAGCYLGLAALLRQPVAVPYLIGTLALGVALERLWLLVRWLSPLRGTFGDPDQEVALVRAVERELSRSLRYKAPLVVVAFHGRRNLTRQAVSSMVRFSDIVICG
ncbi:MAG TPA: hypothetical protein VKB76_03850, partial [Ktedonobacterales bacterium]|nr:hypothetical protein [Ktedonobacterales bacterium]